MNWIRVEDGLPEDINFVLIAIGKSKRVLFGAYSNKTKTWQYISPSGRMCSGYKHITHWMPLPESPEGD